MPIGLSDQFGSHHLLPRWVRVVFRRCSCRSARRWCHRAVRDHNTPALFDWLIKVLSFQGISDSVASGYMAQHGTVRWSDIAEALSQRRSCSRLGGYWRFYDCRYHKGSNTCAEPTHIDACPCPATRCERSSQSDGLQSVPVHSRCCG